MGARFRPWWQQIQKHQRTISVAAILFIVVFSITLIAVVVLFNGTGFNGYNKVTTTYTISGPSAGTVTKTEEYQPGKTFWDLLQLLIIPAVLVVAGSIINATISRGEQAATEQRAQSEREAAEKRAEIELEIALDIQRETALKEYINKISELLLHENLRKSKPDAEVRNIARVLTLTVLPRLNGVRKRSVLQFLYESGLLDKDKCIVDVTEADLSGAYLSNINLSQAEMSKTNLDGADLFKANLSGANLTEVNFSLANLCGANFMAANLHKSRFRNANVRDTDFTGTHVTDEQLKSAKGYEDAIMPRPLYP